jgi:iron complex transport system substrate-binding protein
MNQQGLKPRIILPLLLVLFLQITVSWGEEHVTPVPKRIVSLAPSTTEILFGLGLGKKVIGVTRYCDYPISATSVTRVGGLMDTNYEAILGLRPDLVVLLASNRDAQRELEKMRIPTLVTPHETIADIREAIRLIGEKCGATTAADRLLKDLTVRTEAIHRAVPDRNRPRVLVCVGRDVESDNFSGLYVAGRHTFYDEIIEAAGGTNAFSDERIAYPQLSFEGVVQMNPDVIVDLVSELKPGGKTAEEIVQQWSRFRVLNAVRQNRIHVIVGNHALRPGPRSIQFLEELAHLLHPESFKDVVPHV